MPATSLNPKIRATAHGYKAHLRGFSLLEIIIVTVVLLVLASIALQLGKNARNSAISMNCVSNLHDVAKAFLTYAADHNNKINLYSSLGGPEASVMWSRFLLGTGSGITHNRIKGGPIYLDRADSIVCPSEDPFHYTGTGNTYGGLLYNSSNPFHHQPEGMASGTVVLYLNHIENPSSFWLITDSLALSSNKQTYYLSLVNSAANLGKVHLRHNHRANVLFADGSVRALTSGQLKALPYSPFPFGLDADKQLIQF